MKVWYVSKYGNTPSMGIPTRQFMLSKQFAKRGVDTTLIFSRSNGRIHKGFRGLKKVEKINDVCCLILNGPIISTGFNTLRIFSWLLFELHFWLYSIAVRKDEQPDVIIASSLSLLTFFTAAILKKRFGCKLILEIRDIWPDTVVASGKFSNKNILIKILRWVEIFGYKRADGFVSTLPRFNDYLRTKINYNFKFEFIPQGFDKDNFDFCSTDKYKHIFHPDYFNVCYAGTIGKTNCVNDIIACAKLLKGVKIQFIIIGKGPLKMKLQEACSSWTNIIFLDSVTKKEIIPILSNADLLLNPWNRYEIYKYGVSPNKWIDYMLSGRPMLISYSGYRGLISDANCAFFIEPNNPQQLSEAILKISKMPFELLKKMGEEGRKYVLENLNYEKLGSRYLDFINEIIGK
jgi:glycosyltransferase involved in cell wall biosynthesis